MGMVQYIKQEPSKAVAAEALAPKKEPTFDEKFDETIKGMSRAPGMAKFIDAEHAIFEADRVWRFEEDWFKFTNNYHAKYGPDFIPIPGKSDVFIRCTRERVSTFRTELLALTLPIFGDPWSLTPTSIPRMARMPAEVPVEALEKAADAATAAEKMQTLKAKDYLQDMRFYSTWVTTTFDVCLLGAGVLRGPRDQSDKISRAVRLAPKRWQAPKKMTRPVIGRVPLTKFYWDPQVEELKNASACQVHWGDLTKKQLRDLAKQGVLDEAQVEALIKAFPKGLFKQTQWEARLGKPTPTDPRYSIIERWGVVPDENQKEWHDNRPEDAKEEADETPAEEGAEDEKAEAEFTPCTGYMESWSCGPFVLSLKVNDFYLEEHPFTMVIIEKKAGTPMGCGVAEMVMDIQSTKNSLGRALIDNVAASSIPVNEWDMTQMIPGADLTTFPGKNIQVRPNEFSKGRDALTQKLQPNNSQQLVAAFQLFDGMTPTATSMPQMQTPREMGSGMRSEGMQSDYFLNAKGFMKLVVAEVDETMWVPVITWLVDWMNCYEDEEQYHGDVDVQVEGIKGAVKREMIAKQTMAMGELMSKWTELQGWLDTGETATQVLPLAFGLDNPKVVLSKEAKAEKDAYEDKRAAQAAAMKERMGAMATNGMKAETSRADALLQACTKMDDMNNPAWGPIMAEMLAAHGSLTPQAAAGLKVWADLFAAKLTANPEDQAAFQNMNFDPAQNQAPEGTASANPEISGQMAEIPGQPPAPEAPAAPPVVPAQAHFAPQQPIQPVGKA